MWLTKSKVQQMISEECKRCFDRIYQAEEKFERTFYGIESRLEELENSKEQSVKQEVKPSKSEVKTYPINKTHQSDYFVSDTISTSSIPEVKSHHWWNWDIPFDTTSSTSDSSSCSFD